MKAGVFLFFLLSSCGSRNLIKGPGDPGVGLHLIWWGQSCFSIEDSAQRVLLLDPFDETVGFPRPGVTSDAVVITHEHFDHDAVPREGRFELLRSTGLHTVAGVEILGFQAHHDENEGRRHGETRCYVWTQGGIRFAHLGDWGQGSPTPEQRGLLHGVDVLFVPVGGVTTLDGLQAAALVRDLSPRIVVPMHYGIPGLRFGPLEGPEKFLASFSLVQRFSTTDFWIQKSALPELTTVYLPAEPALRGP